MQTGVFLVGRLSPKADRGFLQRYEKGWTEARENSVFKLTMPNRLLSSCNKDRKIFLWGFVCRWFCLPDVAYLSEDME